MQVAELKGYVAAHRLRIVTQGIAVWRDTTNPPPGMQPQPRPVSTGRVIIESSPFRVLLEKTLPAIEYQLLRMDEADATWFVDCLFQYGVSTISEFGLEAAKEHLTEVYNNIAAQGDKLLIDFHRCSLLNYYDSRFREERVRQTK